MTRRTAEVLMWLAVPPPAMYSRWGARRYHLRVATGILGQLLAVLSFWSLVSLTPLLFTEMSWGLFWLLWVPAWITGARHMNQHVIDRLRVHPLVGLEEMVGLKLRALLLFPLIHARLALTYFGAALL